MLQLSRARGTEHMATQQHGVGDCVPADSALRLWHSRRHWCCGSCCCCASPRGRGDRLWWSVHGAGNLHSCVTSRSSDAANGNLLEFGNTCAEPHEGLCVVRNSLGEAPAAAPDAATQLVVAKHQRADACQQHQAATGATSHRRHTDVALLAHPLGEAHALAASARGAAATACAVIATGDVASTEDACSTRVESATPLITTQPTTTSAAVRKPPVAHLGRQRTEAHRNPPGRHWAWPTE